MNTHLTQTHDATQPPGQAYCAYLEGGLPYKTLVDDRPDAPQVCLGVVVLGHDDLWGLKMGQGSRWGVRGKGEGEG